MSDDFASLSLPELRCLAVRLGISLEHADDREALLEEIEESWDDYGSVAHDVSFNEIMRTKFGFSHGREEQVFSSELFEHLMPYPTTSTVCVLMRGPSWGLATWRLAFDDQEKQMSLRIYEVVSGSDNDLSKQPLSQVDISIPEDEQSLFLHFNKPGAWYRVALVEKGTDKVVALSMPYMTVDTSLLERVGELLEAPAQLKFLLTPFLRNGRYAGSNPLVRELLSEIKNKGVRRND